MRAALVGGMDRLRRDYIDTAKHLKVSLKVFTGQESGIRGQLGNLDMIILFTDKVSHAARATAVQHAKSNDIPLRMIHSSGVTALRKCLEDCLTCQYRSSFCPFRINDCKE